MLKYGLFYTEQLSGILSGIQTSGIVNIAVIVHFYFHREYSATISVIQLYSVFSIQLYISPFIFDHLADVFHPCCYDSMLSKRY